MEGMVVKQRVITAIFPSKWKILFAKKPIKAIIGEWITYNGNEISAKKLDDFSQFPLILCLDANIIRLGEINVNNNG